MAQSDPVATLDHHVVVVGADNTTVRLVEELTRAGGQLLGEASELSVAIRSPLAASARRRQ